VRYYLHAKDNEEGLGWASDGWTAKKAAAVLAELRRAQSTGLGPQTLAEARAKTKAMADEEATSKRAAGVAGITVEKFMADYYIPHTKRTKGSWREDEIQINKVILPAIGLLPMRAVTRQHIEGILNAVAEGGAAPATVKHYMATLRQAFNVAAQTFADGVPILPGPSPLVGIKPPRLYNIRERFLSYEEADKLIDAAKALDTDLHDAIVVALNTGMRKGEILRMEWQDVDIVHGVLLVRDGPMQKPGGHVHVNAEVAQVLQSRKGTRAAKAAKVFPGIKGQERDFGRHFRELVAELGLNDGVTDRRHKFVFHSLRHTFASWLALAGNDISRIKVLMRHKTLAMTDRYTHLIPDATKAAVHNLRPPRGS